MKARDFLEHSDSVWYLCDHSISPKHARCHALRASHFSCRALYSAIEMWSLECTAADAFCVAALHWGCRAKSLWYSIKVRGFLCIVIQFFPSVINPSWCLLWICDPGIIALYVPGNWQFNFKYSWKSPALLSTNHTTEAPCCLAFKKCAQKIYICWYAWPPADTSSGGQARWLHWEISVVEFAPIFRHLHCCVVIHEILSIAISLTVS